MSTSSRHRTQGFLPLLVLIASIMATFLVSHTSAVSPATPAEMKKAINYTETQLWKFHKARKKSLTGAVYFEHIFKHLLLSPSLKKDPYSKIGIPWRGKFKSISIESTELVDFLIKHDLLVVSIDGIKFRDIKQDEITNAAPSPTDELLSLGEADYAPRPLFESITKLWRTEEDVLQSVLMDSFVNGYADYLKGDKNYKQRYYNPANLQAFRQRQAEFVLAVVNPWLKANQHLEPKPVQTINGGQSQSWYYKWYNSQYFTPALSVLAALGGFGAGLGIGCYLWCLQVESTTSTTAAINPTLPNLNTGMPPIVPDDLRIILIIIGIGCLIALIIYGFYYFCIKNSEEKVKWPSNTKAKSESRGSSRRRRSRISSRRSKRKRSPCSSQKSDSSSSKSATPTSYNSRQNTRKSTSDLKKASKKSSTLPKSKLTSSSRPRSQKSLSKGSNNKRTSPSASKPKSPSQ